MSSENSTLPLSNAVKVEQKKIEDSNSSVRAPGSPPSNRVRLFRSLSSFWHDRLVEAGLILSMAMYYVVGNEHLGSSRFFHLNPLYSLPFLLVFAVLCWYRLSFAVALLPLALPYYLLPKTVFSHYSFSLAEIVLWMCLAIALLQILIQRSKWPYRLTLRAFLDRLGPFTVPILLFALVAAFSIVIAYQHTFAQRAFREEVLVPILYLVLALFCLRSRSDVMRLLGALLGTALLVASLGMAQYFVFKNQLVLEPDGIRRVHVMYGSANSIGLFFDYVLPIGLALVLARTQQASGSLRSWQFRIFAIILCLPLLLVLYLSQSRGAEVAIAAAGLFVFALSIRNRKILLAGGLVLVVAIGITFLIFHKAILDILVGGHQSVHGVSTVTKRIYLWESALRMIHDRPWFGFGMENWLCYYSSNAICTIPALVNHHYWILQDPVTHLPTGLVDERTLSHPHNIFLQIWVSTGIIGLLAFVALVVLFFWLFARILTHLRASEVEGNAHLQWMTIGIGAAMLAAMIQGLVDSSFLVQDLAFCFWMLVAALLIIRQLSGTPYTRRALQIP